MYEDKPLTGVSELYGLKNSTIQVFGCGCFDSLKKLKINIKKLLTNAKTGFFM